MEITSSIFSTSKLFDEIAEANVSLQSESSDEYSNDSDESSTDDEDATSYDILNNTLTQINVNYFQLFTKYIPEAIKDDAMKNCKIVKFGHEWNFDEILHELKKFDPEVYQNLFILIIEFEDLQVMKQKEKEKSGRKISVFERKLKKTLVKFSKNRPMILQISFKYENVSKFFLKKPEIEQFQKVKKSFNPELTLLDFSFFFWVFLEGKFEDADQIVTFSIPQFQDSSLIHRFLTTFEIGDENLFILALDCAKCGSKNDIMAILNFSLHSKSEKISSSIEKYFTTVIDPEESFLKNSIENTRKGVHEFIAKCCAKLIGKFNYSFQLDISTTAYEKNQLDYLCDLIDICDFPFPINLNVKAVTHDRLRNIIEKRNNFNEAIRENNLEEINKFIEEQPNLKFVYNPNNSSALHQAVGAKQLQFLSYFESKGFFSPEYHNYCGATTDKANTKSAKQLAVWERNRNVNTATPHVHKIVMFLTAKSFIHNKNISKETEAECCNKIKEWIGNIYHDADNKPHLDVVAQCDNLKMIFDFNSDEVINIDPLSLGSNGVMYPASRWIFIGAKTEDENGNRERKIQGVMTHEKYHYAIELRYENESKPYFKFDKEIKVKFTKIVNDINVWAKGGENDPDDECDGIVSSVFTHYEEEAFHAELIVRVVQIIIEYGHDKVKLEALEKKYKPLFDFHREQVVPDLKNFNLKERNRIRMFNKNIEQLEIIKNFKFKFSNLQDMSELLDNQMNVVSTNIPRLLQLSIYKNLIAKYENLMDTKSAFVNTENLANSQILLEFNNILKNMSNLKIIIDCSKGFHEIIKKLSLPKKNFITFIVTHQEQREELTKMFKTAKVKMFNYTWNDLSLESKRELLQTQIKFLNSRVCIERLLLKRGKPKTSEQTSNETHKSEHNSVKPDLPSSMNDELFKMLVEKSAIVISEKTENKSKNVSHFSSLYRPRILIRFKKILNQNEEEFREQTSKDSATQLKSTKNSSKAKLEEIEITQEEIFAVTAAKKHVLLCDGPGNGKSWTIESLKNFMLKQHPERWTTLVDLKQFIQEFKIPQSPIKINFCDFMIKSILKLDESQKAYMYQQMYTNGNVCVFFDGFDEIAPNHAEFVKKLIKSFEFNDGNQMWIATRDYFQIDLQNELELDEVYKLKQFKEEDGIELIASSLAIYDLDSSNQLKEEDDNQSLIKSHSKYEEYRQKAHELNKLICGLGSKSIGYPHLFQMIVDLYRNKANQQLVLTIYKIFEEFVKMQYKIWANQKGEIRLDANTSSLFWSLNYLRLHQCFAMKDTCISKKKFCDLALNSKEWSEEEIIACGLLIKRGEQFQFQHETFREFFCAQFILDSLKNNKNYADEEFFGYVSNMMLKLKYSIVRMFIDDFLKYDDEVAEKFKEIIPKIAENITKMDFFLDVKRNNLERLENIWTEYFKSLQTSNYEKLKTILLNDKNSFVNIAKDKQLYSQFEKFPYMLLNLDDFEQFSEVKCEFHIRKLIFQDIYKVFINGLQVTKMSKEGFRNNLLRIAVCSSSDKETREYLWNLFRSSYNSDKKFIDVFKEKNDDFNFASSQATRESFELIILELEKIVSKDDIRELLGYKGKYKLNLFKLAALRNKSLKFHEFLWKIIRKYFDPYEIFEMIIYCDKNETNLLHCAVFSDQLKIIEHTWKVMQITVDSYSNVLDKSAQLQQILRSKGYVGRNLLQGAAYSSNDTKSHEYLWNLIQSSCSSCEEFFDILKENDSDGNNVLHLAAAFTTSEVFEFMIAELKKLVPKEDIKKLLRSKGKYKSNLLQSAAARNKSPAIHQYLWKIMRKYFDVIEMLEFIINDDDKMEDALKIAMKCNNNDILKIIWHNTHEILNLVISKIYDSSDALEEFQVDFDTIFKKIDNANSNDDDNDDNDYSYDSDDRIDLEEKWERIKIKILKQIPFDILSRIINTESLITVKILHEITSNRSLQFHQQLWNFSEETLTKREKLANLLTKEDQNKNNYFHLLVKYNQQDVIEFTFTKCKEMHVIAAYRGALMSNGELGRNLLQIPIRYSQEFELLKYIWTLIQYSFDNQDDFFTFIQMVDEYGQNTIHTTVMYSTYEFFEFIMKELEKTAPENDIRNILATTGECNESLLQCAAAENKSVEVHKRLWRVTDKYFNMYQVYEMICYSDNDGDNILHDAVYWNTKEIAEFTWTQIKNYIRVKEDQVEYLKRKGHAGHNLLELSAENQARDKQIKEWVENLMNEYSIA